MILKNLFALGCLLAISFAAQAGDGTGPQLGQPAPNLIGRTLDDKLYLLKKDTGSPKVINFFWVSCRPCRVELPELAKLEQRFKGVKFISVHVEDENPQVVAKYIQSLSGAPSNIVLTRGGLQESFNYIGLPHTIVLNRDNVVLLSLAGYTPENMQDLTKQLQKLSK